MSDCPIPYAFDYFVHHKERNKEPLARSDRVTEAIPDFNIQLRGVENTVKE